MDEKRFRFDLFVAVCALLLSGIAAGAAAYQTYVINEQFSATVWPYLDLNATYGSRALSLALRNDGLGPALVRSATLSVDGKPVGGWLDVLKRLPFRHKAAILGTFSSLDDGDVIRPGDLKQLVSIHGTLPLPSTVLDWENAHNVKLDVCYCSVLQRCWTVRLITGGGSVSEPHDVRHCPPSHAVLES